jgi:predicted nuclease of predicted toxin-antitoxin system
MRFKIDENLHEEVAQLLVAAGHDSETVFAEGLRGIGDEALEKHCALEQRAIVTLDLDFADIRAFPPAAGAGLVVIRLHEQSRPRVLAVMQNVIQLLDREPLAGRLWIVTEGGIRIRGQ